MFAQFLIVSYSSCALLGFHVFNPQVFPQKLVIKKRLSGKPISLKVTKSQIAAVSPRG